VAYEPQIERLGEEKEGCHEGDRLLVHKHVNGHNGRKVGPGIRMMEGKYDQGSE